MHVAALQRLVSAGRLTGADADRTIALAQETGTALPATLDRLGLLSQVEYMRVLAAVSGLSYIEILPEAASLRPHPRLAMNFLKGRRVLPLANGEGGWLYVVFDPEEQTTIKALQLATGKPPSLALGNGRDIDAALLALEEQAQASTIAIVSQSHLSDAEHLQELANNAPTIGFVDGVFEAAIARNATDIHVEPGIRAGRLRLRVDGLLIDHGSVPPDLYPGVMSRLKILAGMDIAERRLPQDGRIQHRGAGKSFDVRAATMPSVEGEAMALRLLNSGTGPLALDDLGFPDDADAMLRVALKHRNGIILVTGPTGSGKTTTLHAILAALNSGTEKIITVENPVEIRVPGIIQIEARPEIGLTFAAGLRSILRHDPDIIMVGEIRDAETATIAIQAALTGHLVLATLHTNDAASSATRLIDMGVDPFLLRATLRLAIAQRLVRVLCATCAQKHEATASERVQFARLGIGSANIGLRRAVGCQSCGQTGFQGRRAIFECADPNAIAEHMAKPDAPRTSGMVRHGFQRAAKGETTIEEVLRVGEPDA
jgi:type II secretory ATPase GspE/PulE/Tfp pilus assembly ATPase PilB-like protein